VDQSYCCMMCSMSLMLDYVDSDDCGLVYTCCLMMLVWMSPSCHHGAVVLKTVMTHNCTSARIKAMWCLPALLMAGDSGIVNLSTSFCIVMKQNLFSIHHCLSHVFIDYYLLVHWRFWLVSGGTPGLEEASAETDKLYHETKWCSLSVSSACVCMFSVY